MCATGERSFFDFVEADDAIFCCMDREVAADVGTRAGDFGATCLAHEHFTCRDFLAAKALHAEARAGVVVDVLA